MKKHHCFPPEPRTNRYYSQEEVDRLIQEITKWTGMGLKEFLIGFSLALLLNFILFFIFLCH